MIKKKLVIKENFNPNNKKEYPYKVDKLVFDDAFNKSLDNYIFPNARIIKFGYNFDKPIENIKLPESTEVIEFGYNFNKPVENIKWPKNLKKLTFCNNFNQPIDNINLPDSLEEIHFSKLFNQSLDKVKWPLNLKLISLEYFFEKNIVINDDIELCFIKINPNIVNNLPHNLKKLKILMLNIKLDNLPSSLEQLIVKTIVERINRETDEVENYLEISKIPFNCKIIS